MTVTARSRTLTALRYALAPICIALAALLHLSPVGSFLHPTGLFVLAIITAAWIGGVGPGFFAALLATLILPQLIELNYPLTAGWLDLPRFVTFAITGLAVGWGATRGRRAAALQRSEERYAIAMNAGEEGFWDWIVATDEFYASPRLLEMYGFPPGTTFAGRNDFLARFPIHPEDRLTWQESVAAHFAGKTPRFDKELRTLRDGETRWFHLTGLATRDASGKVVRWTGSTTDITERKRAEEALRLSEERYAIAMEAAQDAHWDWIVGTDEYYTSPRVVDVFGLAPGTTFTSRQDYLAKTPLLKEDLQVWLHAARELFAGTGSRLSMELRAMIHGEIRWIQHNGVCLRDASGRAVRWCGSVRDVTERNRTAEALRISEERYALAVLGAKDGIWDRNLTTGMHYLSPRAQEISMGRPSDGVDVRHESEWAQWFHIHPDDAARREAVTRDHLKGLTPRYEGEWRVRHQDGSYHWVHARGICTRDASGRAVRLAGSTTDIDARKRTEEALRAAQRLEAMGTLAGGIAHDFNNILGAILGYGEMALRGAKKGSRLRRDLDSIMSAGERGRALVDRILAFSRSGVGERVPVHVEAVVREALDLLGGALPEGVRLRTDLRAGRAAMLGDPTQVHQVVMNLATNGLQAMPHGGVLRLALETVRLESPRATTVGSVAPGNYIVLKVADSGTGIAGDVLERMFDPFFTTKEVGVGSGLGLSLVHGIVINVGGAIDVATELGKGTTFTVYLPRSGDAPVRAADENRPLPRGEGQRVLVVDDEEPLVRLATETLERLGYAPVGFTSSTAALAAFRADPQRFDAVLTDERMPGLSGSALIREVRGIRESIPVVLMSGYLGVVPRDAREGTFADALGVVPRLAVGVGADIVLRKPLLARELATSLARVLRP